MVIFASIVIGVLLGFFMARADIAKWLVERKIKAILAKKLKESNPDARKDD